MLGFELAISLPRDSSHNHCTRAATLLYHIFVFLFSCLFLHFSCVHFLFPIRSLIILHFGDTIQWSSDDNNDEDEKSVDCSVSRRQSSQKGRERERERKWKRWRWERERVKERERKKREWETTTNRGRNREEKKRRERDRRLGIQLSGFFGVRWIGWSSVLTFQLPALFKIGPNTVFAYFQILRLGRGGSSSGNTLDNGLIGPKFDSFWEMGFFLLFLISLSVVRP